MEVHASLAEDGEVAWAVSGVEAVPLAGDVAGEGGGLAVDVGVVGEVSGVLVVFGWGGSVV